MTVFITLFTPCLDTTLLYNDHINEEMVMNIQELLEKFAHINRKVGDLRTEVITFERNSHAWNDSLEELKTATHELTELEDTLIDMGLLNFDARYIDLELNS